MNKIEVAEEILKNSKNKGIKQFITEYVSYLKNGVELKSDDLIRFDKCISYIKEIGFDINGWMLSEIPIYYAHCFWNETIKKAFDLDIFEINGVVIPTYIDDTSNEQEAKTIEEAIEKYIIID